MKIEICKLDSNRNLADRELRWLVQAIVSFSRDVSREEAVKHAQNMSNAFSFYALPAYRRAGYNTRFTFNKEWIYKENQIKKGNSNPAALACFCRKDGLLYDTGDRFELSAMAEALLRENTLPASEYAFVLLSKQWVKINGECSINLLVMLHEMLVTDSTLIHKLYTYDDEQIAKELFFPFVTGRGYTKEDAVDFTRYDILRNMLDLSGLVSYNGKQPYISNEAMEVLSDFASHAKELTSYGDTEQDFYDYISANDYGILEVLPKTDPNIYSPLYPNLVKLLSTNRLTKTAIINTVQQEIYYGSPGTGKSHTVEKFIKEIKEKNPSITDYRTTFHPDYDYASFVGSYKPVVKQDSLHKGKKYTEDELAAIYVKNVVPAENSRIGFVEQRIKFGVDFCEYFNGDIAEYDINHILELAGKEVEAGSKNRVGFTYVQYGVKIGPDTRRLVNESTITYEFVPQVFTKAYVDAWNKLEEGTPVYLVIEEINRGNCAQIFGDIFQLLDRKDDGYSKYPVVPDTDLKDYLTGLENWGKTHPGIANGLCLPPNLNIIATMNTSDQSLFPMDSAFKRRWDWKFIPIDPDCPDSQFKITIGEKHFSWASFITKVNQRILKLTESEDKQIGNFFIKKDIDADEFRSKVMFYLWNDVCKEHYNAGSFFKYTSGEDVENEFTFNQLFSGDVTNILQGFMAYLEVEEK